MLAETVQILENVDKYGQNLSKIATIDYCKTDLQESTLIHTLQQTSVPTTDPGHRYQKKMPQLIYHSM